MKHFYLTLFCATATTFTVNATSTIPAADTIVTAPDTIVEIHDAKHVVVTETPEQLRLKIRGREGDKDYSFDYTKSFTAPTESTISERNNWNFSFSSLSTRHHHRHAHNECYIGGIALGFVTAVNAQDGVNIDMGASKEISWDIIGVHHYFHNSHHALSVSFGIDWRNYRMTGHRRFVKGVNDVTIEPYPDEAVIKFSRIKVFSLTVPMTYTFEATKHFSIDLAAALNFNTHASLKTRYHYDGHKHVERDNKVHQHPVTVDFRFGVCWRAIGLYAKYSPCNVLDGEFAPTFKSFSTGITLFY